MSASIKSTLLDSPGGSPVPGAPILTGQSRDDLRKGYQVYLESVDSATTYEWQLAYTPESSNETSSAAVFLPPEGSTSQQAKFNVDYEGAYLVRLTVDTGLPTEDTQYVRMRYMTLFGDVRLVAAGERRDSGGIVPVDVSLAGWAHEQNHNLHRLLAFVRRLSTSGRSLYVDANRGRDRTETPDDPDNIIYFPGSDPLDLETTGITAGSEGFGDFSTISDAIDYAMDYATRGEPAPSADDPVNIFIQTGYYEEDLSLEPFVNLYGMGTSTLSGSYLPQVVVRSVNAGGTGTHELAGSTTSDAVILSHLCLENTATTTNPVLRCTGGSLYIKDCVVYQRGTGASQGPALLLDTASSGTVFVAAWDSVFQSDATADDDRYVFIHDAAGSSVAFDRVTFSGRSGVQLSPSYRTGIGLAFSRTRISAGDGYGIRGACNQVDLTDSSVSATNADKCISIEDLGGGPLADNADLNISRSSLQGHVVFDTAAVTGTTALRFASSLLPLTSTQVQFPSGAPDSYQGLTLGTSLYYDNDYTDPATGTQPVPSGKRLTSSTVQEAIDELVLLTDTTATVTVTASGTYTVLEGISYIGVDTVTAGAAVDVVLPNSTATGALDGRLITIKDEGGGSSVSGQEINVYVSGATSTIDGVTRASGTPLVLDTNYEALRLICRGATGTTSTWFII